jgi:hypothetical protein
VLRRQPDALGREFTERTVGAHSNALLFPKTDWCQLRRKSIEPRLDSACIASRIRHINLVVTPWGFIL